MTNLTATPTGRNVALRYADFNSLPEALDYAARAESGFNFHDARGQVSAVLPYAILQADAQQAARRLLALDLPRGASVPILAETSADFAVWFFACQYAGLVPVPVPVSVNLGGREAYEQYLQRLIRHCRGQICLYSPRTASFVHKAVAGLDLRFCGTRTEFDQLPPSDQPLQPLGADEPAYIQYTSGSTRFPRGAVISSQAVMRNIEAILSHGVQLNPDDRFCSWLPVYHDMGLVGKVLAAVAGQVSVDYLDTRSFAMRPRLWLELMSRHRTSISFGAPFGYDLVARRLRVGEADRYDLSNWRVAGVGADMIRPEVLTNFVHRLSPAGFRPEALVPSYGMAEVGVGISFAALREHWRTDCVARSALAETNCAMPADSSTASREFVDCGEPLPGYEVEVRDSDGNRIAGRNIGTIFVRGPSVMEAYYDDPEGTRAVIDADGWLNTGDLGYWLDNSLVITGRQKEMIIVNGRNIWPQDLEYLVENRPELRAGDAIAFSVLNANGADDVVVLVQCRLTDPQQCDEMTAAIGRTLAEASGLACSIVLVPPHSLPRTSSGKPARHRARDDYVLAAASNVPVYARD